MCRAFKPCDAATWRVLNSVVLLGAARTCHGEVSRVNDGMVLVGELPMMGAIAVWQGVLSCDAGNDKTFVNGIV